MSKKIRKQIYLERRQQERLRRVAEARGLSQAELIRQALDREAQGELRPAGHDLEAWEQAMDFMRRRTDRAKQGGAGRRPAREDLYTERIDRRGRRTS